MEILLSDFSQPGGGFHTEQEILHGKTRKPNPMPFQMVKEAAIRNVLLNLLRNQKR